MLSHWLLNEISTKKTLDWQRLCTNDDVQLDQMNNGVYRQLNDLTTQYVTDGEISTFGSKVDEIWAKINEKKMRGESYGLPSKFKSLKEYFADLDTALAIIREEGNDKILLMAHSTGGLITPYYLDSKKGKLPVDGLILNSPFLDWNSDG